MNINELPVTKKRGGGEYNHSKKLPAITVLMHSYRRDIADVLQRD
jgi:hypothetical protein